MLRWNSQNFSWHSWNNIFPSKFALIFTTMTQNAFTFLAEILYTLVKMIPLKCKFWDFQVLGQNSPNSSCHFSKQKSVTLQIFHHSFVLWHASPLYFFGSNIIYFWQKQLIKTQIFRLPTARIKIHQIIHFIFRTKSLFFFRLYNLQRHER